MNVMKQPKPRVWEGWGGFSEGTLYFVHSSYDEPCYVVFKRRSDALRVYSDARRVEIRESRPKRRKRA